MARPILFALFVSLLCLEAGCGGAVSFSAETLSIQALFSTLLVGQTQQLTAQLFTRSSLQVKGTANARWSSASPLIATVDERGLFTCVAQGTTTISATTVAETGTISLTCSEIDLSLTGLTFLSPLGPTSQLQVTAAGPGVPPTNMTTSALWSSADPLVATISGTGLLTCASIGRTQVNAIYLQSSASLNVVCTLPTLVLSSPFSSALVNSTTQLSAALLVPDGTSTNVTSSASWQSSSPQIASVSTQGELNCQAGGQSTFSATLSSPTSALSLTANGKVLCIQPLSSLGLSPSAIYSRVGTLMKPTVRALDPAGRLVAISDLLVWTTSSPVASVSPSGVVSCIASGSTTITAAYESFTGSALIMCAPPSMNTPGYFAEASEEFVGPFNSWANVKTAFGAKGDGVTDDSAAIQRAVDSFNQPGASPVLWFPEGSYVIKQPILGRGKFGFSLIGADPDTTQIAWLGPSGGTMLTMSGCTYFKVSRLTLNGNGIADTAEDVTSLAGQSNAYYSTFNELSDQHILGVQNGIKLSVDAETAVERVFFDQIPGAALSMGTFNTLNIFVNDSLFLNDGTGVTNIPDQGGQFIVSNSFFAGSSVSDMSIYNTGYFTARHNTSVGSHQFWNSLNVGSNTAVVTLQNNRILDPGTSAIEIANLGPMMLIDNVVRQRDPTIPTVLGTWDPTAVKALFSMGNTWSPNTGPLGQQGSAFQGTIVTYDDSVTDPSLIPDITVPTAVYHPPNYHRQVFEVAGASNADVQNAVRAALASQQANPVVHFAFGSYATSEPIALPNRSEIQLVGDDITSTIINSAVSAGDQAVLIGTSNVSIGNLKFRMVHAGAADGIDLRVIDQPSTQVTMDQVMLQSGNTYSVNFDGVEHLTAEMFNTYTQASRTGVNVRGGSFQAMKRATLGITNFYTGSLQSEGTATSFDVSQGGKFMVQDNWHDGGATSPHNFNLSGSGTVTEQVGAVGMSSDPFLIGDFDGTVSLIGLRFGGGFQITPGSSHTNLLNLGLVGPSLTFLPKSTANFFVQNVENSYWDGPSGHLPDTDAPDPQWMRKMLAQTRSEYPVQRLSMAAGGSRIRFSRVAVENALSGIHLTSVDPPTDGSFELTNAGSSLAANTACPSLVPSQDGGPETRWDLIASGEGDFQLASHTSTDVLTVVTNEDGPLGLSLAPPTGSYSQRWIMGNRGTGSFKIENRATGAFVNAGSTSSECIGVSTDDQAPETAWTIIAH